MVMTTEDEIDAAIARAEDPDPSTVAKTVEYHPAVHVMIFTLGNGRRLVLPMEDLQGLGHASQEQLSHSELLGPGTAIYFPDLDVDFHVPSLVKGIYGNERWMRELASRGDVATKLAV